MASSDPDQLSFQSVAESVPIMIWMSGLDLGCYYFNRAWLEFTGRTLAQEYGNGWAEGVHPDELESCVAHYTTCFQNRVPFAMNYRLRHYSGEYFWILDRGAPHYSVDGQFLGFFGGCAETDAVEPAVLNAQLRTGLAKVETFARDFAATQISPQAEGSASPELITVVKDLRRSHALRASETRHAKGQIEKLASDMVTYRGIPHGALLR